MWKLSLKADEEWFSLSVCNQAPNCQCELPFYAARCIPHTSSKNKLAAQAKNGADSLTRNNISYPDGWAELCE